ncbi:MAG TPA: alpha/beta hydrolase [Longimicrobium sp.]|jgi:acetyl esterase/lipase|nr:alpha/beta hydrolase [Longimicrobium sp.]
MRRAVLGVAGGIAFMFMVAGPASAQVVNLWPGAPPGSEGWTQEEKTYEGTPVGTVIQNVTIPTLTAYLPDPANATGAGVIIAPGGYFVALAISLEGTDVAQWLQQHGIAAFVLKYRILEKRQEGVPGPMNMDSVGRFGMADGIQAVKVVRQHAAEWGVDPDRVGFLGFSAGAMVASATVLQADSAARPNFAAMIYGGPFGVMPDIPQALPPLFMAWAQDDAVALAPVVRFYDALRSAGHKPEVHIFGAGGHGFGMRRQGTTSDRWIDAFYAWMQAGGFTGAASTPR